MPNDPQIGLCCAAKPDTNGTVATHPFSLSPQSMFVSQFVYAISIVAMKTININENSIKMGWKSY